MKILIITYLYPGYPNQSRKEVSYAVHDFAKEWVKLGHDVHIIRLWNYYPRLLNKIDLIKNANRYNYTERFNLEGVKVTRLPLFKIPGLLMPSFFKKASARKIKKILKQDYPDVIISHMINNSLEISSFLGRLINRPFFLIIHGSDLAKMTRRKLNIYKKIEPNISRIGFRTENLLRKYYDEISPEDDYKNIFIVNSGVDKKIIKNPDYYLYETKKKYKQILVVGHLVKQKNIDSVLKAFSKINSSDYTLKIIGDGKEKNSLIELTSKLNIQTRVIFKGQVSKQKVIKEMEKSEIFILTSKNETLGLVYLEAMSQGCLTIGSKGEGIDGIIKHKVNGFLCEPNDENSIVKVLYEVMNMDKKQKQSIIKNAFTTINKLTTEKVAIDYLNDIKK